MGSDEARVEYARSPYCRPFPYIARGESTCTYSTSAVWIIMEEEQYGAPMKERERESGVQIFKIPIFVE